jgi:hypothetical protein
MCSPNIVSVIQTKNDEMDRAFRKSSTEKIYTHLALLNLRDYPFISFDEK